MSICPDCGEENPELHSLPCSHVLCLSCIEKRGESGDSSCPICSQTIPKDGLFPPKFSGEFRCDFCSKWKDSDDFWFCKDCVSLTCSYCSFRNHNNHHTHEWDDSSQTVRQILNELQTLSQGVGDDLGNRGKWRELMLPVIRALAILVKDKAASVRRLSKHVQEAYQLPATAQLVTVDGEGSQSLASGQQEKLDSNLKVLGQLLNLAKSPDPSLTRRVRGFKSSPEAVAQLIFDQLDFGEEDPATPEEQENIPLDAGDDEPVEELVEVSQNLESSDPLDKPFHLCMEKEPISFVFGSHWALVVLWTNAAEIWNIRDRGDGDYPVLIRRIKSPVNRSFKAAAVFDQETISPTGNSRLYILVELVWYRWSVMVINLNTGALVNKDHFKVYNGKPQNIASGRIACSPTNAVAMVALNSASNNQQPCKLWELGSDMKLKEFTKNPIPSIKSLAVLSPEKGISLVATKTYSEPTAINLYQISSAGIQLLSKISDVHCSSSFFWFPDLQPSLWIHEGRNLNLWEVDGSGELKLVQSAEIDAKPNAVVGFIGGRFVAASSTSVETAESNRLDVWVSFFWENCNGVLVPVSP